MSLVYEALCYHEMGWAVYPAHAVDPDTGLCSCGKLDCPCPGKHPIGQWFDYKERMPTEEEVRLWFDSLECNIGVITGRVSGIAVVDIDGEEGKETIQIIRPERTLSARTGSKGLHYFYKIGRDEIVPTRTRIASGIDIRGEGGYIILPPSRHLSGRYYEWLKPKALAPFESKLFNLRNSPRSYNHTENPESWADDLMRGVGQGSRNSSTAKLAGKYLNLGLSLSEIWTLLHSWNQRNQPPLDESELKRTVLAIHRKHNGEGNKRVETLQQLQMLLGGR